MHIVDAKQRIEYPSATCSTRSTNYLPASGLAEGGWWLSSNGRKSPRWGCVDRKRASAPLVEDAGVTPTACWSPGGDELWWLKQHNVRGLATEVHAVTLTGQERVVASLPGEVQLVRSRRRWAAPRGACDEGLQDGGAFSG